MRGCVRPATGVAGGLERAIVAVLVLVMALATFPASAPAVDGGSDPGFASPSALDISATPPGPTPANGPPAVAASAIATPGASISEDATDSTPSHYYACDGSGNQPPRQWGRYDGAGILMSPIGSGRFAYHPVNVGLWALSAHEAYLHSGNPAELAAFLNHARWLRDVGMDACGRFPYWFSTRGLRTPWYSAMAQGLGMSVFARAWVETGDESFRQAALRALQPMTYDISGGGVITDTGADLWLEEYPDRSKVLNGAIFALWGVWDTVRITGDPTARRIFDRASATIRNNLPAYERGDCILYQLQPASYAYNYHGLHIQMLRATTLITGDPYWSAMAGRWESSFRPYPRPNIRLTTRRTIRVRSGKRAVLRGSVRPLARAATMIVTARGADGIERYVGSFTVSANRRKRASSFRWRTPPMREDTTFILEFDWQRDTHTEVHVVVR